MTGLRPNVLSAGLLLRERPVWSRVPSPYANGRVVAGIVLSSRLPTVPPRLPYIA
jgi:hypothetical protein